MGQIIVRKRGDTLQEFQSIGMFLTSNVGTIAMVSLPIVSAVLGLRFYDFTAYKKVRFLVLVTIGVSSFVFLNVGLANVWNQSESVFEQLDALLKSVDSEAEKVQVQNAISSVNNVRHSADLLFYTFVIPVIIALFFYVIDEVIFDHRKDTDTDGN